MSKRYKWFGLFAVCIMVLGSMILLNEKVYAAQLNDTKELKEAYANAVWRCYAQDFLKKEVNKEDLTFDSDKLDPASLMSDGAGNFYNGDYYWSYSGQRNITCKDSFDKGVKQNVFDMFKGSSVYPSARNDELTAFMEHLGYSADTKNMEGAIGFCYRNDEYQKIKNCFYWPNEKSLLEDPNENKKLVSADRSQGISDVNVSLINKEISFSLNFWDQNSGIQRPKCYVKYSNNWSFESGHCGNGNYWDYIKFEN